MHQPAQLLPELAQAIRPNRVFDPPPPARPADQPGLPKDPEVVGEQVLRDAELRDELAYALRATRERREDGKARRISEGAEPLGGASRINSDP
jgi:hypothetical protein